MLKRTDIKLADKVALRDRVRSRMQHCVVALKEKLDALPEKSSQSKQAQELRADLESAVSVGDTALAGNCQTEVVTALRAHSTRVPVGYQYMSRQVVAMASCVDAEDLETSPRTVSVKCD